GRASNIPPRQCRIEHGGGVSLPAAKPHECGGGRGSKQRQKLEGARGAGADSAVSKSGQACGADALGGLAASNAGGTSAAARSRVNRLPPPGRGSYRSAPPCASARPRAIERPRPAPPAPPASG